MGNTYTQLLVQIVFAVKYRRSIIHEDFREPLEKYMTGIIQNNKHKLFAIYCMPDHCHILVGLHPAQSLSDLVRDIKSNSSKWINDHQYTNSKFQWQEGFGAFSYAKSELDRVVKYILNQPENHRKRTFKKEYIHFLNIYHVDYDEQYLFDWFD